MQRSGIPLSTKANQLNSLVVIFVKSELKQIAEKTGGRVIPDPQNAKRFAVGSEGGTGARVQFNSGEFAAHVAKLVKAASMKIADEDLEDGRDEHPHITLAFGVNDDEPDNVEQVLEGEGPITAKIGKVSMFPASESGKADVLKIDVTSRTLHRLHKKIGKEVDVTDSSIPLIVPT